MSLETTLAKSYVGCENIQGEGLKYVTVVSQMYIRLDLLMSILMM
jgi:hypothetical protein